MKKTITLSLLAFFTVAIIASGCSHELTPLQKNIRKIAEGLRNKPGRTGILAEKKLYSLFDEELIIRDFFSDRKGGFYVDVGCAWPIKANNTYYLEKHLGWTGIGIDALDDYAVGWKEKRPNSKFFCFLVTNRSGGIGTFFKSENIGLSSADNLWASGVYFAMPLKSEKIEIPMITLNALLDREGIKKIDLLSMDIEGNELKALAGFDVERFSPDLIAIESRKKNRAPIRRYFNRHGYEQIQRYVPFDCLNLYFCRKQDTAAARELAQPDNDADGLGNAYDPDDDNDDVPDDIDNCPVTSNGPNQGTCLTNNIGEPCMSYHDCDGGTCSMNQEDTYPPQGNSIGDACDCEGNFDCDGNVDAEDVTTFLIDFGRNAYSNPCGSGNPCNGDFECDGDVDSEDVTKFLEDFGRNQYNNPCPDCEVGDWCVYP